MKLKDFINEDEVYTRVENEIKDWVEKTYKGLTIEFYPNTLELLRTDDAIDFDEEQVKKITEVVNIKIGDILEEHDEEIYIAERLTRIWKKHPKFNIEVESIEDIKRNEKFLKYLKELIIKRPKTKVTNIEEYRKRRK